MKYIYPLILLCLISTSCANDSERATALVNVFLVDAPADFEQVWVEILGVEVQSTGTRGQDNADPVFLENFQPDKQVNLAAMIVDNQFLVGRGEFLVGAVTGLTLRLGTDNYVVVGGKRFPLTFADTENQNPSIKVNYKIDAGISYDLFLDFEVFRSISGSPTDISGYVLRPKLRPFSRADTGEIGGKIIPNKQNAIIYAIQGKDTVTATAVDLPTGKFKLRGVVGNFTISILPFDKKYQDTVFNVKAESLMLTQLDDITLRIKP